MKDTTFSGTPPNHAAVAAAAMRHIGSAVLKQSKAERVAENIFNVGMRALLADLSQDERRRLFISVAARLKPSDLKKFAAFPGLPSLDAEEVEKERAAVAALRAEEVKKREREAEKLKRDRDKAKKQRASEKDEVDRAKYEELRQRFEPSEVVPPAADTDGDEGLKDGDQVEDADDAESADDA